jgi:hypothetical protein
MEKADDIISNFFGVKKSEENINVSSVLKNWNSILVDRRLPDHCRLEDLNSTRLTVSFDHQGWMQVFKMHQSQILRNMKRYVPKFKITSVRMIMRSDIGKYTNSPEPDFSNVSREDENSSFSDTINDIHDEELKKRLENLKKKLQGN